MGRKNDAPRVVGFDFGVPGAPGAPADPPPGAPAPPPPPPAGYDAYGQPTPPASPPPPAYPPPPPPPPAGSYPPPPPPPAGSYPPPPAAPYTPPAQPEYGYGGAPAQPDFGYGGAPAQPDFGYGGAPAQPDYGYGGAPAQPAYGGSSAQPDYGYGGAPAGQPDYGYTATATQPDYGYAAAPGGAPAWSPPGYASDLTPTFQQPPPKRSGLLSVGGAIRIVVIALVAFGGVKGAMRAIAPPVTMPNTLGGMPRDNSAPAKRAAADMAKAVENVNAVNSAAYGDSTGTVYLLLAGDSDDKSGRGIYDTYVRDMKKDGGRTTPPQTFNGITCTTTTVSVGVQFSVCFWGGAKSDGFVVQLEPGPLDELALVTAEARDAINR